MKTAIYPGTFDPITHGHIDVIKKSLKIFDKVVVSATDNINKNYLFTIEDRILIINSSKIDENFLIDNFITEFDDNYNVLSKEEFESKIIFLTPISDKI